MSMRTLTGLSIALIIFAAFSIPARAAVGIYNRNISAVGESPPVTIEYRLNCAASVSIEITTESSQVVCTLGPFQESAGLHSHQWDGTGALPGSNLYRARITATSDAVGSPGSLVKLSECTGFGYIYGLAVDRFDTSPGCGTIYVSYVRGTGYLKAYNADGSMKLGFGGSPSDNTLNLDFVYSFTGGAPWGIGVDSQGNIYTACKSTGTNTGVKVFDYSGNELYHVFQTQYQGNVWLDGLTGPNGLEVYETLGPPFETTVRASRIIDEQWQTVMDPGIPGTQVKQICFEPGGSACYVAVNGYSSDPENPNVGVVRFLRQPDGSWTKDAAFDCGLKDYVSPSATAAEKAFGVSCDARDPDGPYKTTSLWMGLDCGNDQFGGNIARKTLPAGQTVLFAGPDLKARIVGSDSVGNLVLEYGTSVPLWTKWGIFAPGGEASSDVRMTGWVRIGSGAAPDLVDRICEIRTKPDGRLVELRTAKTVSAVFSGCFYIQESDRCCGIRVESAAQVSPGDLVRLRGQTGTSYGERTIEEVEILP